MSSCAQCGSIRRETDRFCGICGNRLTPGPNPLPATQPPASQPPTAAKPTPIPRATESFNKPELMPFDQLLRETARDRAFLARMASHLDRTSIKDIFGSDESST